MSMTSLLLLLWLLPLLTGEEDEGEEDEEEKEGKVEDEGRRCTRLGRFRAAAISAGSSAPATRLGLDRAPAANV